MVLSDLGLRSFREEGGIVMESTKTGCPIAKRIPFKEFLSSKPYFTQSRTLPMNAHEVLVDIISTVEEHTGIASSTWGEVTVYRDKMDIHGYVEKHRDTNKFPVLHPGVELSEVAFSRIITKLPILGNDDYSTSIAVKWEPGMCQVAMGLNVRICDNYNIFSNDLYETGKEYDYFMIREKIIEQLKNIEERYQTDIRTIAMLLDKKVSEKQLVFLMGEILYRYGRENQVISVTDLTAVQRAVHILAEENKRVDNLWAFTNCVTDILKFDKSSGDSVLQSIQRTNAFVNSKLLVHGSAN